MRRQVKGDRTMPAVGLVEFFDRWDAREIHHVRRCVNHTERAPVRHVALALNRLSNGSLYPLVAVLMLVIFGRSVLTALLVAMASVVAAHLIYPRLKNHCARRRPFDCDPTIKSLLKPLDQNSFPSGHVMTAMAAFLPLVAVIPALVPVGVLLVILIGWSRLAAGHHYPSDLAVGALMGSLIAAPGLAMLLY